MLICGGLILSLSLGQRHSFGLFLQPMTLDLGWGRETFSFAIALQNLVWGLAQPFTGMIADKYGSGKVAAAGAVSYTLGLLLMADSRTGAELIVSAGLLVGLGLSGTGFAIVYGVVGRAFKPEKRSAALGVAGALGSFGQFILLPLNQALVTSLGWGATLIVLSFVVALMLPLSSALAEEDGERSVARQPLRQALREAFSHQGFWLLTMGFLTCGFQLAFIATHLPTYLIDRKVSAETGMTALALVGLFNIPGTYLCGYLGDRFRKKYLLSALYLARGAFIALFVMLPISPFSVCLFSAAMGLLWLGTVPLTNGLVGQMFGVQYMATLFGFVFFSHQVGSFLGAWLGGYVFDATGSYGLVWMISIALSVTAGIINWPIDDREAQHLQAA